MPNVSSAILQNQIGTACHRRAKGFGIGDVMIGGEHQHHRIVAAAHRIERRKCDGWRGIARGRFQNDCPPTHADRTALLRDDEAMLFVADQIRRRGIEPIEPQQRVLQHRLRAGELEELLWVQLAGQRPQPRAGAAGENHWEHSRHLLFRHKNFCIKRSASRSG